MVPTQRHFHTIATLLMLGGFCTSAAQAVSDDEFEAMKARLEALEAKNGQLQSQVQELTAKENSAWLSEEKTAQIRGIVEEVLADAKKRGQLADGPNVGYQNGFYIQTADQNFKLVVGGLLQVRYEFALHHADNSLFTTKPLTQGNTENSNGFSIRRARVTFSGNAFTPNLFYRLEGDFYASSNGAFTVTDAFMGYCFNDQFKIRAGSFKAPFTKAELENDANLQLERSEVNFPFDAQRSIGVSLFGDIMANRWSYEINANNGAKSNTLRAVDTYNNVATITSTSTPTYNLDNRMAFYARTQFAGSGTISEFYDGGESDLRTDTRDFIWMIGGAAGYESQNSSGAAFAQNTLSVVGLGSNDSPGFIKGYVLNGDLYRATLDWSAKWRGLSINLAGYFQEVNANPFAGTTSGGLPYAKGKSSFFQAGYSGQVGYMIIPQRLEILGRVGILLDEGDPNVGEFYTVGVNYYIFGNNAKILADVNYTPEAAYTDAATLQLLNTHEVVARVQIQLKF